MMDGTHGPLRFPWEVPPENGQAIEVAEGVLWIRLPLPMALDHVNIYALDEGESWTIVDTGIHSKRSVALWDRPCRRRIWRAARPARCRSSAAWGGHGRRGRGGI